jgi:type I restriction enzyme S subunit
VEQVSSLRTEDKFKKTEVGEIPVEWDVVAIGNLVETSSGGTPSRNIKEYFEGKIPWVKSGELEDNIICDTEEKITENGLQSSSAKLFPKGTLLIALYGATVGKTGILGIDATTNQAVCAILNKKNLVNEIFLQNYFIFKREQLITYSSGAAQPNISQEIIRNFVIALPPYSEQKKIAHILSTIDSAFEKSAQVIEKTKELKKGLMQELLMRGIGHKRFKKTKLGAMPEEWEISPLRNLTALITKGTTPTTYGHSYTNDGVLFLRIENISEQGEFILGDVKYISGETNEFLARSRLQAGDVLFSIAGALGRVAIVSDDLLPANINQALALIRLKNDNLNNKYLKYILHSEFIKNQISPMAAQLAQANLNLQQVGDLKIPIPQNSEQKEIVAILSSVDEKIEKEVVHKEKLENIKKGLMQVLLTGKIRVK